MSFRAPKLLAACTVVSLTLAGCKSAVPARPAGEVDYVGSSTVALFLRDAETAYGAVRFRIDSEPESEGGERALLDGRADFAGIANIPQPETLELGLSTALIGRDAIAVLVNSKNPIAGLSMLELRRIFTGEITNWSEVGGPDLQVKPFIVSRDSATRRVFRSAVLGSDDYVGCEEVSPDRNIVAAVASEPGGIGQISFAFIEGGAAVRAVEVDSQEPTVTNFDYPISRPLYFIWRPGNPVLEAFIEWTLSAEGQRVVMKRFVGRKVLGSASGQSARAPKGTLVVRTETFTYYDGGIDYHPHRPYEIYTREGELVRRVLNHRGENDENPTRVELAPGTYLIRTTLSATRDPLEFLVTVDAGSLTELDVLQFVDDGN